MPGRASLPHDESVRIQTKNKGVGLIRLPAKYIAAKKQMFPNANLFLLGGCRVSPTNPKTRKCSYCPQCREAEKAWLDTHPKSGRLI
jgi:hypothetical protein